MGLCHSHTSKNGPSHRKQSVIEPQPVRRQEGDFGLSKLGNNLKFQHAPLNDSEFLMEKFYYDNRRPEEINLMWQVTKIQIVERQIVVNILAQKSVNIWLLLGGQVSKNITGLYLSIKNCKEIQKSEVLGNQRPAKEQSKAFVLDKRLQQKDFLTVILESQNCGKQSLFLISNYVFKNGKLHLEEQDLQWNSLSFQLEDIYGNQETGEENKCVICNQAESNCILLPCRHLCLGRECLDEFKDRHGKCPLCKGEYDDILVYKKVAPV